MTDEAIKELEVFFSKFKRLHYKKGQLILRGDDVPNGVYYIHKGYVRLYSISESGQELSLIIFKPQDLFPLRWAFTGSDKTYYCEAMTAVEVTRASKDEFVEFAHSNTEVLTQLVNRILIRLGGLLERMEYAVFGNALQKVASILVICAERFGEKRGSEVIIKLPLTHKDIAGLIGLTRETTSVEVKKLERAGILEKKTGHIIVKKYNRLKAEALWTKFS